MGAALAIAAPPASAGAARYDQATILVKFRVAPARVAQLLAPGDRVLARTLTGATVVRLADDAPVAARVVHYRTLAAVRYAEPNFLGRAALSAPNDSAYGQQWGIQKIRAVQGWEVFPGSYTAAGAPAIAVVDTGVDSNHPDLDAQVRTAAGADCVGADGVCRPNAAPDDHGHGTHVAGIAAAETNNAAGVAGMAFAADVIPVKVLDATAKGTYAAIANGIVWGAKQGARVINLSLGGTSYSQTLCDAVAKATSLGALVVAAAGNNGSSAAFYPAACKGAVGVGATDSGDGRASFSNYGNPNVFMSAPGVSVYSTYPGGRYTTMSGTSMAAPFVSGVAALLFGAAPSRGVPTVKTILASSATKVGGAGSYAGDPYGVCSSCTWNATYGYGRLDAYSALLASGRPADFGLSLSPPELTVVAGSTVRADLTVAAANGFSGTVDLSVTGVPVGARAALGASRVTPSAVVPLTISTLAVTPVGNYEVTVTGRSGSMTRTLAFRLIVTSPLPAPAVPPVPVPAPADFALSVEPATIRVTRGLVGAAVVVIRPVGGFAGIVDLSADNLPAGTNATFLPGAATGPGVVTVLIQTTASTPVGLHTIKFVGTSGGKTRTAYAALVVASPS